ncbi:DUF11 domain-containing protein [Microbacterium jejuense]|uniref:DUF11 domain-containing protein n=1 Tax=Microbacterium jejuense TaxID=1263637 RepID=A0ABS7HRH1_9MICO|nr:DUF11 domain-containing protein [Microbacterium jejuense]MBW9094856.1 DUF11 domain-containing protein [Microbacterium jejuense]
MPEIPASPHPSTRSRVGRAPFLAAVMTAVTAVVLSVVPAVGAQAATVYEIDAAWADGTPSTVRNGDVVTGVWHVNLNDDAPAPDNDPVDDVTVTITAENGRFPAVPNLCLTRGVDPVSAVSEDGRTLTCNLGTRQEGTAVVLQAPIVVDGGTGSQVSAEGAIGGQTASLSPIEVVNVFGMDIRWNAGTSSIAQGTGFFETDFEWTLVTQVGSDPGPQTVTYDVSIVSPQGGAVQIAPQACTPFDIPLAATGHPWSGGSHPADQMTGFVDSCTIVPTGVPGQFRLTLSGIDYEPADPPTRDSAGNRLPVSEVAVASGSIWVRILTTQAGSAMLTSNAPVYTSVAGATAQDDPANNTESKSWTLLGTYSSGWGRGYTNSGGTTWDLTYRVSAGTEVGQYMDTGWQRWPDRPDTQPVGMCSALDTRYVTFDRVEWGNPGPAGVQGATIEYYTGSAPTLNPDSPSYDPDAFFCGDVGPEWSTTLPADPTQVRAVRVMMSQGQAEAYAKAASITPVVYVDIKPDTPAGTHVWSFMQSILDDANGLPYWTDASEILGPISPTPGWRYPYTYGYRDVLRVVSATPWVVKSVDRAVVSPGDPATYTLTYSANGAGAVPATVDGFQLVDTLPVGVTYVAGTASPEPVVSTNGSGQQVLTWTLDGVTTNADHALTYQAVADGSVTPGQALTNAVSASYGGITKSHSAQVTVATDGYTEIGKVADSPFIPNVDGEGTGEGSWTVTLRSFDPLPQEFTDTIDILPYVGDARGTDFAGSYELTGVDAAPGATVYYTTADPATLSDDPADASNGAAGDPAGSTAGWSTTFAADATAVRVIGPELAAGATQRFTVTIATEGVEGGDTLVNRAQARAEHTALVMRTSAPITVANYYSASLKKYVQDADGTWRDANDVTDYPTYRVGDEVPYRIVITNTGQGTLRDLRITDDRVPEGAFTVDELAPGDDEVHEYTMTVQGGDVVNTACASAAIPDDSGIAPTINCDPAGIEVVNYAVAKSSDPAAGTVLHPGDEVTYTVTVTQEGTAPAPAEFADDLAEVLDDADLTAGPTASIGTAAVVDGVLSWSGTVPVGGVATITYTVTVKDAAALASGGSYTLVNGVTSPGCPEAGCPPVEHPISAFDVVKSSDPADGANVEIGDTIEYTVTVSQRGEAAYQGATFVDDLSDVLDDATWNSDEAADGGTASFDPATQLLSWSGGLAVGEVVRITYSVTVTGAGDTHLHNVVTSDGCASQAACETEQYTATYTTVKSSDPASGSDVQVGDVITYTVTVTQSGEGRVVGQFFTDDLAGVLDDAAYNNDLSADAGTATFDPATGAISWSGELGPGDVAEVTYSVTVTAAGDTEIGNVVQSPGCETAAGCETTHQTGRYAVVKSSDPASRSDVQIGDTVAYTITVSQIGEAPVTDASFTDDLSDVLDDAEWSNDLESTAGMVGFLTPTVSWSGDLAVGQVVTVTYSVVVTGHGDKTLTNVVTSAGCSDEATCTTTHQTGAYTVSKSSDPAPGSDVAVGDAITYTVTVAQIGPGAVDGASFTDDLSAVLDDATWNGAVTASAGEASFDADAATLTWAGDLPAGAVVTVTYTVTVTGDGDMTLTNVVVPGENGECVPAADGNPECTTTHQTGRFEYSKMADPIHNSDVQAGDVVTYTVVVRQVGPAGVAASLTDDLSDVLDDADYNGDVTASAGEAGVDGTSLTWAGTLGVEESVTITYSVTVTGAGNTTLANVVTSPSPAGECVAAAGGTEGCRTVHKTGGYVFAKTADPVTGSTVHSGDIVTYTVTVTQRGEGAVTGATVSDDLSGVLDDASFNDDAAATAGSVTRDGDTLEWSGDLAVGQTATITYSVTVTAAGPAQLRNVVTSSDERAICDPAGTCTTEHDVPAPPPPALAITGGTISWAAGILSALLLLVGTAVLVLRRRREPTAR